MNYCSKCGAQINPESRFCPSCGQPIEKVEVQPQPQEQPQAQPAENAETQNVVYAVEEQRKPFYRRYWWLLVIVAFLVVMAVTVPDKKAHISAVKSALMEGVADTDNSEAQAAMMLGNSLIDKVLDSQLHVDNYVLFSLGKVSDGKEDKTISVGVLTHVFVGDIDKEKMKEAFK